jgi:hypothetical protein
MYSFDGFFFSQLYQSLFNGLDEFFRLDREIPIKGFFKLWVGHSRLGEMRLVAGNPSKPRGIYVPLGSVI